MHEVREHEEPGGDRDAGGEPPPTVALAHVAGDARGPGGSARCPRLGAEVVDVVGHGFGTSSMTVVPEPGEEKTRARPPTVCRRPTTDSA